MTRRPFIFTLFVASLTFVISISPLLAHGQEAAFFSLDPDTMYVGNILSYVKNQQIYYIDHPGTPAIRLLSVTLIPLRIYARLVVRQPFIYWSIEHPDILYYYLRIAQAVIAASALFVYLVVIYRATRSLLAQIFAWLALFSFSFFPHLFSVISGEATNFLIVSIWLVFLSALIRTSQPKYIIILSFLAGLAVANRLTNLFIVLTSFSLVFTLTKITITKKIGTIVCSLIVGSTGFFIGSWTIRHRYQDLFWWVRRLATTSETHGGGTTTLFDLNTYSQALISVLHREIWPSLILGLLAVLLTHWILIKKRQIHPAFLITLIILTLGSLVFAKYPLTHYQLGHYFVFVFLASVLLGRHYRSLIFPIGLLLLSITVPQNIKAYYKEVDSLMAKSLILERFVSQHPPQKGVVWEWGLTGDFALLWGRDWSAGSYDQELKQARPNLFSLQRGFRQAAISRFGNRDLFTLCWDQLFIQNQSLPSFLEIYQDKPLIVTPIPNTKHSLVTSSHCRTPF